MLHPDVVLRADFGPKAAGVATEVRGADQVAARARMFSDAGRQARPATVNGAAGVVAFAQGRPVAVMGFTVVGGKVAAIDVLGDPERLERLDLAALDAAG